MKFNTVLASVAAAAVCLSLPSAVNASLLLTPVGVADGFTLTTFVSGYHFNNYGPLAQGILPNGNVITGSAGNDRILVFSDTDNQTLASALISTPYTFTTSNPNYAMTTAGGQVYGAQLLGGALYEQFSITGAHSAIPGLTATNFLGMWGNPVNGHIIAASNQGLIDINPLTGTFRVIAPNPGADGVSVSPDGSTLYAEAGGNIRAYNITTGALLHIYSGNGHAPDGTGVITGGLFNGFIIANNNDGTVGLIDPTLGTEAIIAIAVPGVISHRQTRATVPSSFPRSNRWRVCPAAPVARSAGHLLLQYRSQPPLLFWASASPELDSAGASKRKHQSPTLKTDPASAGFVVCAAVVVKPLPLRWAPIAASWRPLKGDQFSEQYHPAWRLSCINASTATWSLGPFERLPLPHSEPRPSPHDAPPWQQRNRADRL